MLLLKFVAVVYLWNIFLNVMVCYVLNTYESFLNLEYILISDYFQSDEYQNFEPSHPS